jgi:hypothetical protein
MSTGAANLDVIQEVEYVKQEAKVLYLLTCLQKTAPPVLIFAENKKDVDDVHEYLLLKGVAAASIHGGKTQVRRMRMRRPCGESGDVWHGALSWHKWCARPLWYRVFIPRAFPFCSNHRRPRAGGAQRGDRPVQGRGEGRPGRDGHCR